MDHGLDEEAFDASTFAKNKERLLRADVARRFFEGIVQQAKWAGLLSAEHFTVDGTLVEAWASPPNDMATALASAWAFAMRLAVCVFLSHVLSLDMAYVHRDAPPRSEE